MFYKKFRCSINVLGLGLKKNTDHIRLNNDYLLSLIKLNILK